jgi:uncharacterized protein YciW
MIPLQKYYDLIDELREKTIAAQLRWKEAALSDAVQHSFSNYSILLHKRFYPKTPNAMYAVLIYDSEGERIDSFSDADLDTEHAQRLAELYQRAQQQARSPEKAIDEILNALKDAR